MLQDFFDQFQVASFMFAEFDLAADFFAVCNTTLHIYFAMVAHAKQHQTNYYCAVFSVMGTMLCVIKQYMYFAFCSALFVC